MKKKRKALSLPSEFKQKMLNLLGNEYDEFEASLHADRPTTIRTNPFKYFDKTDLEAVPWSMHGYYLIQRPKFNLEPSFHAGAYYVQEASSMIIGNVIKQIIDKKKANVVLDLCAAPGGKSTDILSNLSEDDLLIANEVIAKRNFILQENIQKWGQKNTIVTQNKSVDFKRFKSYFDIVVVDAPCAGEGLFRKNNDATMHWSQSHVEGCAVRQSDILTTIKDSVKTGGFIVYSTCSYSLEENETIVDKLCEDGNYKTIQLAIEQYGIVKSEYTKNDVYRCYTHKINGEGLTFSVLQRMDEDTSGLQVISKQHKDVTILDLPKEIENPTNDLFKGEYNGHSFVFSRKQLSTLQDCLSTLNVRYLGIPLGKIIRNNFIPDHALAVSNLNLNFGKIEITEKTNVLTFLKGDIPNSIKGNIQNGFHQLMYQKNCLGWIKGITSRWNNYYPKHLRIRS